MSIRTLPELERIDKLSVLPGDKSASGAGMSIDARERLIIALDAPPLVSANPNGLIEMNDAQWFLDNLPGVVSFVKIGWPLYMAAHQGHAALIKLFRSRDIRVFLDLKFGDIPETVKRLVLVAVQDDVEFITVNTTIDAVQAAVKARGQEKLKILTVTLLTSQDKADLEQMGNPMTVEEYVLSKTQRARDEGHVDGVIASGKEAAAIRERMGKGFLIVTPGIRPQGAAHQDHKRATTPTEAIRAGADYLVVGRPITRAPSPRDAALKIIEEMQKAFDSLRS